MLCVPEMGALNLVTRTGWSSYWSYIGACADQALRTQGLRLRSLLETRLDRKCTDQVAAIQTGNAD